MSFVSLCTVKNLPDVVVRPCSPLDGDNLAQVFSIRTKFHTKKPWWEFLFAYKVKKQIS